MGSQGSWWSPLMKISNSLHLHPTHASAILTASYRNTIAFVQSLLGHYRELDKMHIIELPEFLK
jgi:hypothetical protein